MNSVRNGVDMIIEANTNIGKVRSLNEDAYLIKCEFDVTLLIVADGMGGHNAGEVASEIAKLAIEKHIFLNDFTDTKGKLIEGFSLANQEVFDKAESSIEYGGMGTTLTAVIIYKDQVYIANVGDSRTYLFRDGKLEQITKDHSYVQRLVDRGFLKKREARFHPRSNVITRAIGINEDVDVDIFEYQLIEGDMFLLCSDGLTDHVDDEKIKEVLQMDISVKEKVNTLIEYALKDGGSDNITVIIAHKIRM